MFSKPSHEIALNKAKIGIMSKHNSAFICTILFSLKHHWDETIPTAAVDGINLFINQNWFMGLSENARIGLLAHEAWHVAFDHITRGNSYEHKKYNIAADYVINIMLQDNGFTIPDNGYIDTKYRGMSTEEVYKKLPAMDKLPIKPGTDDIIPLNDLSAQEVVALKDDISKLIIQASIQAKIAGDDDNHTPQEILIGIDNIVNPRLNWSTILMNYMTAFDKSDYSFKKFNKRFWPDYILPSLNCPGLDKVTLAFDISASVTTEEFNMYYEETKYLRDCLQPNITNILTFDTKITTNNTLQKHESMDDIKFVGRGGTRLEPVFEYLKENPPTVLIVFSDLECKPIKEDPTFPVVWIAVNAPSAKVNFGTLIHCDTRGD